MKVSLLDPAAPANGSEGIPVVQTVGGVESLVLMNAAELAQAGTRPTPAELQSAILAALVQGNGLKFTTDANAGTITIAIDSAQLATVTALNAGLANKQDKSTILSQVAGLTLAGNAGKVVKVNPTGDGLILDIDLQSTGGGSGLADGTYGDVVISNGGAKMSVVIAADKAYGATWNGDMSPATRNALYAKLEALNGAIGGKVSTNSIGVANGVASLDATGKVPAGQLPSYVDDVLEFNTTSAFPNPGETGKIYVAQDTNRQSRWTGTAYVELTASPGTTDAVPEGPTNKYYTDVRVRAAPMTGLIDVVGTPAAADSLLAVLGKLKRQAFGGFLMPVAGGTFTGPVNMQAALSVSGFTTLQGNVGIDAAANVIRSLFFLNNGGYAADISLQADNATIRHNSSTAHVFNVQGAEQLRIGINDGVTVSSFSAAYGVGVKQSRAGQVGYHMYNAGQVAEWLTYQPAHAQGDDYRIATFVGGTVTDRFKIGADGNSFAMGNFGVQGELWTGLGNANGSGILRFGGAGSNYFLWFDGANYQLASAGLVVSGNITSTSDRRLKSDIRPLEGAAAIVGRLNGYRFTIHDAPGVGVIAQEVEEVLPELVTTDTDGMKSVDYGKLTAVLIEHNKALEARLAALEARLAA